MWVQTWIKCLKFSGCLVSVLDITYLSQPTSKTPFCPQAAGMAQWILQKWRYFSHRQHTIRPGNASLGTEIWNGHLGQITFQALPDVASCDSKGMNPFSSAHSPSSWEPRNLQWYWIPEYLRLFTHTKEGKRTSQVDPGPASHQRT